MTTQTAAPMTVEKLAWVMAYLAHFGDEKPARVLEALGIADEYFERSSREHYQRIARTMRERNPAVAQQFATELALAKAKLAEDKPTLEDVRATYAKTSAAPSEASPDETAMLRAYLPDVVLPFKQGEPARAPAAVAPPMRSADDAASETLMITSPFAEKSIPFPEAEPADTFNPDETLPMQTPAPPKKS